MSRDPGDWRRVEAGGDATIDLASATVPAHVAVIMDGNGRWATLRRRPRSAGHIAGVRTVRSIVEQARRRRIPVLTLYAFSSDNWRRPADEVNTLMRLFRRYLAVEVPRCIANGVRVSVIGRRDRLDPALRRAIEAAEEATREGTALRLRLAVDYSSRDAIVAAAGWVGEGPSRRQFARVLSLVTHDHEGAPDVDLLIRTGGEQRLSDFLLWECAYAELLFSRKLWPDFTARDFDDALAEFARRERRFGAAEAVAG